MQESVESKYKNNESASESPFKTRKEDFTFGKSPIKSPRTISKGLNSVSNGNYIRNRSIEKVTTIKPEEESANINFTLRRRKEIESVKNEEMRRHTSQYVDILGRTRHIPPKNSNFKESDNSDLNFDKEKEEDKKKKKDWKSWSPQEKELFYEAIANGGNYSSLQKLFKTMNDVIN